MATAKRPNPFRAGPGLTPPYIAGRQNEIGLIEDALDVIEGGAGYLDLAPYPTLVLVGPRGVGKTVLLQKAVVEARKRGIHMAEIDCKLLSGPVGSLVSGVFPDGFLGRFLDRIDSVKVQLPKVGLAAGLKDAEKVFKKSMEEFLANEPLLLVLDEAHHCDSDSLNMLFGVVQSCMRLQLPLALILAGTPGLEPLMQRCKATYVERSKFLRINTLSDDEAKEALAVPARESGFPMKPGALKLLHGWADNYPYFIQMAGMSVCDIARNRGGKEMTVADAKAGLAQAGKDRGEFYEKRYDELKDLHLADHAIQVVRIMDELGVPTDGDDLETRLMEVNDGMDIDGAMQVVKDLREEGFIWRSTEGMEPGIPSMFQHIGRKRRAS